MAEYQARTKSEVMLEIRHSMRLHFLHARLYDRVRKTFAVVSLIAGGAALYNALQSSPVGLLIVGLVISAAASADLVFGWAEKEARHRQCEERFADLLGRALAMELGDIDRELIPLCAKCRYESESLRYTAMNDALKQLGYEDGMRPETRLQRLMRAVA